ncbi:type II CRISPR RNA-guided endonuclease Cas9 [Chryseobacterium aquaticum]|uniref:CRISPR-associated endonuclease Cas9 n=1 Tax=Chryseobacterium aquaticum subsp. greenlandense TaxID=345663 RepID=A0A101CFI9_9FLAO|nr:type II CRISPR RNA-guided endonuclease Cas9 [Chryseobacterium aquaticum]KUJ55298.1 type II CRISPR RNA-guided endonuclease Cas9 [Chryseobacterium aquaticum subsp. greenlandense]
MTKNILGLDLGTNSIGWALIKQNFENKQGEILGMGSRIIPMSQDILGDFGKGNSVSQTAERTKYRSVRRLRERFLLRRERLHRVLNLLNFLPQHYASQIDFEKRFGKFKVETEPKLAWKNIDGQFSFLFQTSFNEMLEDFRVNGQDVKIPYDWTIYYLRKKALSKKIEKEELAWILLNFNQKRGYYQLRGEEEEENPNKLVEFYSLKVVDVVADEPQKGKFDIWYSLILENGWVYRRSSKIPLFDWKDKTRDFIVTTDLNDDGSIKKDKDGNEKRSFRAPSENDWTLVKKKTEQEIEQSRKTVGTYIYEALLDNPKQKIKGKLVRTIERKFYKEELRQILEKQKEFHQELQSDDLYNDCVRELYRNNEAHQLTLSKKDFVHLLMDDLIFYQRPLRSQKSSVSNCTLEFRKYKDENGAEHTQYLKAIPKSNPYYQEFRLWQWIYNLNIYRREDEQNPITGEFLSTTKEFENLFEFLNTRKEVDQKALLKHFKLNDKTHRWNFVEDKKYPCNETKTMISSRLEKVENISDDFLTREIEQKIWHIIYSVNDKIEYEKALKSFAKKHHLDESSFFEAFRKFPPFKSEYGSFSEKAVKKLLPLMRLGKYWNYADIDKSSKERIQKIISGEYDENIKDRVREKSVHLTTENDFQGLQLWLAQYIVYGRHSEASMIGKWNSADDLEEFLKNFKQHSLRNPIVEQVITETLRVVKDIWLKYGNGAKDFFNEIHIELGREMKLPAKEREDLTRKITENENTNLRIKALLAEMMNDSSVENVRPFSPMQQEILKIYEDGVLNSGIEIEDEYLKISKTAQPSPSDLKRYKLWLEQKYKSPYTGQIIPLNKLFTPEYEIEHIIPQSRYFDDSFSNKIICESAVNKLKDNYIGLGFIKQFGGTIIELGFGKSVKVFETEEYEDFVKKHYANNRSKRNKLLLEDIPEKMIERQINDTRHISKYISGVLSNIVRIDDDQAKKIIEDAEILARKEIDKDKANEIRRKAKSLATDDGINSKNIVPGNGKITTQLKQDWGLNDVWNDLILPRFERMNQLTNSKDFTVWNENHQKYLPTVPIEFSKGFSKKRIDHRHHALDALVIACATKDHVNLLNNQSAKSDTKRYDLKKKLMKFEKVVYHHTQTGNKIEREIPKQFLKPWENFTFDAKYNLESIIVSFKQNLRVINKATNYYEKYVEKDGTKNKGRVEQTGTNWAIRKPMHKDTVSGKVNLPWVKVPKGKILTATRKILDTSFDLKSIGSITDTGIQKILRNYLEFKGSPELAFSPEGIEDLNKNIEKYNDGKPHQPINKVRVFELGSKFQVGQTGNKKDKYVEAAKGTNLFFAVYEDKNGKRSYETIPLNEVIERQKQGLSVVDLKGTNDFYLCPNDLVYIPSDDELENINNIDFKNIAKEKNERIYKVVSFSGSQIFFVRQDIATSIVNKAELSTLNKMERAMDGSMIKESCVKLNVDRLGNISKA